MDVSLSTNRAGASLEFRRVERYADGSGFGCLLVVESAPFSALTRFYFEAHPAQTFLGQLRAMDAEPTGTATLKPIWEPGFVRLDRQHTGQVVVSGELPYEDQLLRFAFVTDQTCLRPLIRDVGEWLTLAAG